jgi:hypothetical protein
MMTIQDADEKAMIIAKAHNADVDAFMTYEIFQITMRYADAFDHAEKIDRVLRMDICPKECARIMGLALLETASGNIRVPKSRKATTNAFRNSQIAMADATCDEICTSSDDSHVWSPIIRMR